MAARKANLNVHQMVAIDDWLFKDMFVKTRTGKGIMLPEWPPRFSEELALIEAGFRKSTDEKAIYSLRRLVESVINAIRILVRDPSMNSVKD